MSTGGSDWVLVFDRDYGRAQPRVHRPALCQIGKRGGIVDLFVGVTILVGAALIAGRLVQLAIGAGRLRPTHRYPRR